MEDILVSSIPKLQYFCRIYEIPNSFGLLLPTEKISNKKSSAPKCWGFLLGGIPSYLCVTFSASKIFHQILSTCDPEFKILAFINCAEAILIGGVAMFIDRVIYKNSEELGNTVWNLKMLHDKIKEKKKSPFSTKMKKIMEHAADSYFICSTICCVFASSLPFLYDLDPPYFTIKVLFPKYKSTWWMRTIRSFWGILVFQRWVIGSTIVALMFALNSILCKKIVTKIVELGKCKNIAENYKSLDKAIGAYRQLHILIHSLNRCFRWTFGISVQGVWFQFIMTATVSIWYSHYLLISPNIYGMFTSLVVISIILSNVLIPLAESIYSTSSIFMEKKKTLGLMPNRGYYLRLLKAQKLLGIEFGNFEYIYTNYLVEFFKTAMEQVIGLVMAFRDGLLG